MYMAITILRTIMVAIVILLLMLLLYSIIYKYAYIYIDTGINISFTGVTPTHQFSLNQGSSNA